MCGICGIFEFNRPGNIPEDLIRRMTNTIIHRGPDDEGIYTAPGIGFGFLAMIISYLPILYQAFSRREITISMLDARAGSRASSRRIVSRFASPRTDPRLRYPLQGPRIRSGRGVNRTCAGGRPLSMTAAGSSSAHSPFSLAREGERGVGTNGG